MDESCKGKESLPINCSEALEDMYRQILAGSGTSHTFNCGLLWIKYKNKILWKIISNKTGLFAPGFGDI